MLRHWRWSAGNPVIAYKQGFGGSNAEALCVAQFNGTAFASLGHPDSVPDVIDSLGPPQIAIAPDGRPWVVWPKSSLQSVRLASLDGTAFVVVPIVPALPTFNGISALTLLMATRSSPATLAQALVPISSR